MPLDPAAVERFAAGVRRLAGAVPTPDRPLALAVSGGPDSVAMLALAAAAFPRAVVTATYDHRARPGSADEAAAVGAACALLGIAHQVLRPAEAPLVFRHAAARAGRYAALNGWAVEAGARFLLTAHHADDQAETLLMRLNRGSGIAGLSGIRERLRAEAGGTPLTILRPLLDWRRTELRAVAAASGLRFVDDPANADDRFDRTRLRRFLADQDTLDPAMLARAARHLGEAEADLAAITDWLWAARRRADHDAIRIDVTDLPRELRRRLARRAIAEVASVLDPAAHVEPLLDALEAGRAATQAGVLARSDGTVWHFAAAPPRRAHRSAE